MNYYKENLKEELQPEGEVPEDIGERTIRHFGSVQREGKKGKRPVLDSLCLFVAGTVIWNITTIFLMYSITAFNARQNTGTPKGLFDMDGFAYFMIIFFVYGFLISRLRLGIPGIIAFSGSGFCLGVLAFSYGGNNLQAMLGDNMTMVCLLPILASLVMIFVTVYKTHFLRMRRCTHPVTAQCSYVNVEMMKNQSSSRAERALKWVAYFKYYYNGLKYYCDCETTFYVPYVDLPFSLCKKPSLNRNKDVMINPDDPKEYWEVSADKKEMIVNVVFVLLLGIVCGLYAFTVAGNWNSLL